MKGNVRNFYAGGNTAKGFHNLYDSSIQGLDRLFILKGGPGTGKSSLMKKIGEELLHKGYDIEFLHCSSDNNSLDGIIIPTMKVGVVDGTAPHVIEPKAPGAIEEYVNLGSAWDSSKLIPHKEEIQKLTKQISETFQKAYNTFAEALKIHDEWEKVYITNMDFKEADKVTNGLIELFFANNSLSKKSRVRDMFFGAATPNGAVDFIPNLTENISKRYFIKGRPGSGKSTLLKKLAAASEEKGYDVEVYHCGFDPNSLDMLIFPELDIAIFDSTAPHLYYPDRESDEIVDMYERVITPGTDEKYADELDDITERYAKKMKEGISYIAQAKSLHDELEKFYVGAMDFKKVEAIRDELLDEILKMIKE